MATTAERQQRFRAHHRGDHGLCLPERCDQAPQPEPDPPPKGSGVLGPSGQQLWDAVLSGEELEPMRRALLLQACRIVDRLDQLEEQLQGGDWLQLDQVSESTARVVVDQALSESRQQATALKQVAGELRQGAAKRASSSSGGKEAPAGGIADLSARIAARRDGSAG